MKVFTYWEGEVTPLVRRCIDSWGKLDRFDIVFLDGGNISSYVVTTYPRNLWSVPVTTRSDVIRLMLLYKYGGLWMDASTYINAPLHFLLKNQTSMFMFRDSFPDEWTYIHNWFIYCPFPENPMMGTWLDGFASWIDHPYTFEHPCTEDGNYFASYEVLCALNRTNRTVSHTIDTSVVIRRPDGCFYNPFLPLSLNGVPEYDRIVKFTHVDRDRYWRGFPISELLVLFVLAVWVAALTTFLKAVKHARLRPLSSSWIPFSDFESASSMPNDVEGCKLRAGTNPSYVP